MCSASSKWNLLSSTESWNPGRQNSSGGHRKQSSKKLLFKVGQTASQPHQHHPWKDKLQRCLRLSVSLLYEWWAARLINGGLSPNKCVIIQRGTGSVYAVSPLPRVSTAAHENTGRRMHCFIISPTKEGLVVFLAFSPFPEKYWVKKFCHLMLKFHIATFICKHILRGFPTSYWQLYVCNCISLLCIVHMHVLWQ